MFSRTNMISVNNSFASWFNMDHFTFEEKEGFFSLTRTTFLNKNGTVGYYCFVLDCKGKVFSPPPLSRTWTMGFFMQGFFFSRLTKSSTPHLLPVSFWFCLFLFLSWQVIGLTNALFLYWDDYVVFLLDSRGK